MFIFKFHVKECIFMNAGEVLGSVPYLCNKCWYSLWFLPN